MTHTAPFLTLLVLLPAAGALVLALLGFDRSLPKELVNAIGMLVSGATLVIAVATLVAMKVGVGGYQLVSNHTYTTTALGVRWFLGVDGISWSCWPACSSRWC